MKLTLLFRALLAVFLYSTCPSFAQNQGDKALQVAHDFFDALEKGDSTTFRSLFLPTAMVYTIRESNGKPALGNRSPFSDKFRPGIVIKERMKSNGVEVHVHGRMAVVWAPYNLWINDVFSHCGIDVFTLIKVDTGWKITSLSYTIEKEGCDYP
jgi:hypothetical protein